MPATRASSSTFARVTEPGSNRDELRQIVAFIGGGGLDAARDQERQQLELEKQRLKERERGSASMPVYPSGGERDYGGIVTAASDLLRWLVG